MDTRKLADEFKLSFSFFFLIEGKIYLATDCILR